MPSLLSEQRVLSEMATRLEGRRPEEILQWSVARYAPQIVMATGFGPQSIAQLHMLYDLHLLHQVRVFYLDTGLLFSQTHETRWRLEEQFGFLAEAVTPGLSVEEQDAEYGPELWSRDPTSCCRMRKVEPLRGRLRGERAWLTGLRRSQSATRSAVPVVMWDEVNGLAKINPMAAMDEEAIWKYLMQHKLPYNPLRDQGYRSIGCIHCTRPISDDADERAGRWTGKAKTECGIHLDGNVIQGEAFKPSSKD